MRLSDLLNDAPNTYKAQVENFLGYRLMKRGQHKNIDVGVVCRNYHCHICSQMRTYTSPTSPKTLSCLMIDNNSVSIDVTLQCPSCSANIEVWFLITGNDDLFSQSPTVSIVRCIENRQDVHSVGNSEATSIPDLFERAQIAYNDHLGSGSMVYLRQIYETLTRISAEAFGIPIQNVKGKKQNFRELLKQVDSKAHIIPTDFSANGYTLFSELSSVIHGESDEQRAMAKYEPCKTLIKGVLLNINNNNYRMQMKKAANELGWPDALDNGETLQS